MRRLGWVVAAACLAPIAPVLANPAAGYAVEQPAAIQAFDSPYDVRVAPSLAPSFGNDPSSFDANPAVVDAAKAPQALSEPSSAGLLFFGAGLIGLCYLFDALVRPRKS